MNERGKRIQLNSINERSTLAQQKEDINKDENRKEEDGREIGNRGQRSLSYWMGGRDSGRELTAITLRRSSYWLPTRDLLCYVSAPTRTKRSPFLVLEKSMIFSFSFQIFHKIRPKMFETLSSTIV
jgi:hypothetical protein